jgi:hypothetical protein
VHDRQLDGRTLVFGNQGALYKTAMTWFDHATGSIWSQPIGTALAGELKGTRLRQIPSTLHTWEAFRTQYPDAKVMATGSGGLKLFRETPRDDWVIGVALGDDASAVYFPFALRQGVVHADVGGAPVLVWADAESRTVRAYLARVEDRTLSFESLDDGRLRDRETGSIWDARTGLAQQGELAGKNLSPVPWTSSFDWAWRDFYPNAEFIGR